MLLIPSNDLEFKQISNGTVSKCYQFKNIIKKFII